MPTLRIRGDDLDVEALLDAIRERIALRAQAGEPVSDAELAQALEERLRPLDDWNFPRETWQAMWPPRLRPWNLDEDYPIRSHRGAPGALLVRSKRLIRTLLGVLARPLLTQQVLINRCLALMSLSLAEEVARERLQRRALEQRLARVGALLREMRGEAEPLVELED